jgi:anti-anti-sigma factor
MEAGVGQGRRRIMRISTSKARIDVILIEVEGEIDAHTAPELDKTLKDLLAQGRSRLVLDASRTGFISSAGLRAIVFAEKEASQSGGQLRVCGLNAQVRRLFEIAGLDACLSLNDTVQEAMESW